MCNKAGNKAEQMGRGGRGVHSFLYPSVTPCPLPHCWRGQKPLLLPLQGKEGTFGETPKGLSILRLLAPGPEAAQLSEWGEGQGCPIGASG